MNAKWTKWTLLGFVLASGFVAWAADPEITQVTVRQRWPWSRLVDIDYVLQCEAEQSVDLNLQAYNGDTPMSLPYSSLSGKFTGLSAGAHHIVWDPTGTLYANAGVLPAFRVVLTPTIAPLYVVIDLSGGASASSYPVSGYVAEADVPGGVTNDLYKTTSLLMRRIPAQTFLMSGTTAGGVYVAPAVSTTLTKPFYAGVYEVTQKQWERVMGDWPAYFNNTAHRDMRPVERVSYYDIRENSGNTDDPAVNWPSNSVVGATSFMGRIRAKTGIEGFDLPTEAQSECLCRAGTVTVFNDGNASATISGANANTNTWLAALGRYKFNGGYLTDGATAPAQGCDVVNGTAVVGSFQPNLWGLYDTHGNVSEWCLDWYGWAVPTGGSDPAGKGFGDYRMFRGGAWGTVASFCGSGVRNYAVPSNRGNLYGFRLVRTMP